MQVVVESKLARVMLCGSKCSNGGVKVVEVCCSSERSPWCSLWVLERLGSRG